MFSSEPTTLTITLNTNGGTSGSVVALGSSQIEPAIDACLLEEGPVTGSWMTMDIARSNDKPYQRISFCALEIGRREELR